MTPRKVTKLFAVVALATATPAVAGPQHANHEKKTDQVAVKEPVAPTPTPTPVPAVETKTMLESALALLGVTVPRRLPNGAPACGNVQGKGRMRDCTWKQ